jgi:hypothetical protein
VQYKEMEPKLITAVSLNHGQWLEFDIAGVLGFPRLVVMRKAL